MTSAPRLYVCIILCIVIYCQAWLDYWAIRNLFQQKFRLAFSVVCAQGCRDEFQAAPEKFLKQLEQLHHPLPI